MAIRNPQASVAAREVSNFLTKHGIQLAHAQCLELVALTQGYKNAQHASAVSTATPKPKDEEHVVYVHFGEEATRAWEEETNPAARTKLLETAVGKTFATQGELDAYCAGLNEGNGWNDFAIVEADEASNIRKAAEGGTVHTVRILVQNELHMKAETYAQAIQDLALKDSDEFARGQKFSSLYMHSFDLDLETDEVFIREVRRLDKEQVTPDVPTFHYNAGLEFVTFDSWYAIEVVVKDNFFKLDQCLQEIFVKSKELDPDLSGDICALPWLRYSAHTAEVAMTLMD